MDRLQAMTTFDTVSKNGSFTAAAKVLGVPLPTVSRRVSELESHLGTRLFERSTRRLSLTNAGRDYLRAVRRILDEVDSAERAVAGEYQAPRGELVVTAPTYFAQLHLMPIIAEFLANHPLINVRVLQADRNLHLIEDHVDVGVRIGALPDSAMIATKVGEMRTVTCAAPALLASNGTPRHPNELAALPSVEFTMLSSGGAWQFQDHRSRASILVPISPRLSVNTAEAAVWAASRGIGIVRLLHYQAADALKSGALQLVLRDYEPDFVPVHLLHAGRGAIPVKTRAFLDFAAVRLRHELSMLAS